MLNISEAHAADFQHYYAEISVVEHSKNVEIAQAMEIYDEIEHLDNLRDIDDENLSCIPKEL